MTLPKLYKKTNAGAIQEWEISVHANEDGNGAIVTKYGQVDGAIQTTIDTVTEGKNIGKKNETSAVEQAQTEAKSKWEKQKKKGYVESIEAAKAGEVDELIEGGIFPMLAQKYRDHAKKIVFPALAQKKLDGSRCVAIIKNGKASLWTRTRKPIKSMPHIVKALEEQFEGITVTFDGELYHHDFHNLFNKLMELVRPDEPRPGHEKVQYHIYDVVNDKPFSERSSIIDRANLALPLVPVKTIKVANEDEMTSLFVEFVEEGYEGLMIRNAASKYEQGKRSYGLQKVKEFVDDEFDIVGVQEGRGAMAGRAIFICKTKNGQEFTCKMEGPLDGLRKYLTNSLLWKNKKLTVKYQNLTEDGIPRFPVGKAVRDYE